MSEVEKRISLPDTSASSFLGLGRRSVSRWAWSKDRQVQILDFWLILAFLGVLAPRFVNLSQFTDYFLVNNFIDILVSFTDLVVILVLVYELVRRGWYFRLFTIGLLVLGLIQIFVINPTWMSLVDNWLFSVRFLLWVGIMLEIKNFFRTSKLQFGLLLALILLYSLLDHLLLSNPVPVLLVWILVQIQQKWAIGQVFQKFWLWVLAVLFGLNFILAAWQVFTGGSLGLHFLGEPFLHIDGGGVARQPIGDYQLVVMRAYGTMQHPNALGFVGVVGFWFVSQLGLSKKWTGVLGMLSSGLAILSFSRIAWIGLVLTILVWFLKGQSLEELLDRTKLRELVKAWLKRFWWLWLGVSALFLYVFLSRFAYDHGTDRVRLEEYVRFGESWFDLPWWQKLLGTGLGQYPFYLRNQNPDWFWWEWQPVHNLWLSLFFELGVLTFVLMLASVVGFLVKSFKRVKTRN